MKYNYFFSLLFCLCCIASGAAGQTTTFSTAGGPYAYTVPQNVTSIGVDMKGGSGGNSSTCLTYGSQGGKGGRVQCNLAVTAGQVLYIYVGGAGSQYCGFGGTSGGTNGGGASRYYYVGSGGGASDIRTISGSYTSNLSSRLVVAGGGGGAGYGVCCSSTYQPGGDGGGTTGHAGYYFGSSPYSTGYTGGGGTQSAGGTRGTNCCGSNTAGALGSGGLGNSSNYGGGGGGGYYGGGGAYAGGGGGGSSFPAANGGRISNLTHTQGNNTGNGSVVICAPTISAISGNTPICLGNTKTLTNSASGGTWSSSNTSIATVSSTGVVTSVSTGTATISYAVNVSGCGAGIATAVVTVNPNPSAISGNTALCNGATSTLSSASSGGTWTSSNTAVASVGSASGVLTGVSTGTATITYTLTGGCFVTAASTVNPQPASITGTVSALCGGSVPTSTTLSNSTTGGAWSSSSGVVMVGSSSGVVTGVTNGNPVISYTLPTGCFSTYPMTVNAVADIGGPLSLCNGTAASLSDATSGGTWSTGSAGIATISGTGVVTAVSLGSADISYTVSSTGCSAVRTENVTITPNVYAMTGGGAYCSGGTGVHVGLSLTDADVSYQLYNGATAVGSPRIGNGGTLDFGAVTGSGPYGAIANEATACATNMSGGVTVTVNSLPTQYSVTGTGSYCSGGLGRHVFLSSSVIGFNYQLYRNGSPEGSPVAGTSASIDFGAFTNAGTYTVQATNTTTSCVNDMLDSATISIDPLPTAFTVNGGGGYCIGGTGVHIGLSSSATGVNYQLMQGSTAVGAPLSGTGASLDFGLFTTAGTYTIVATNATTSCQSNMSGSATVVINPLPAAFTVMGGGSYCSGGTGVPVGVNGSTAGVNYQLYSTVGTTTSSVGSSVAGTGSAINFGSKTTAATYSVVATNATTGCVSNMLNTVSVSINPLPAPYLLTGGGGYCVGGTGLTIGLSGSASGTIYQLFNGATLVGATTGTSGAVSFGLQRSAGTYTVTGTNPATGCSANMSGSTTITINSLPTVSSVTGGGNYCAGSAGVNVGLSGSQAGVNYQLFNGTTPIGTSSSGTGGAINFGSQTGAGGYTVVAYNPSTTCSSNMSGSAIVAINPVPVVYVVTGGGSFCSGGSGVDVALASSDAAMNYQLMNGGSSVGAAVPGAGGLLDFGMITTGGTYSVVATNPGNGCTATMGGTASVVVNALPAVYSVTDGGNYCAGGAGMPVNLSGSTNGVNYQLFAGSAAITVIAGTGSAISFGLQTATGSYTAVARVAATGCSSNMSGTVSVGVNALPTAFMTTGGGDYCAGGTGVHVGLAGSSGSITYQLINGVSAMGSAVSGTGAAIDFGAQTAGGSYTIVATDPATTCTATMTGSAIVNVDPLPLAFNLTGGGNYCTGGFGVPVGLNGSATGINYQLYRGGAPMGIPVAGTGFPLDYGLQTVFGSYTAVATDAATGCVANMPGSTTVVIDPLPVLHTITGGGNYCAGGAGVNVALDNSTSGTSYQLYNGAVSVGASLPGVTGAPLNFGLQTTNGAYTVMASTSAGCAGGMLGSVNVGTNALPSAYTVTGGGNYCSGGAGVSVGLSGSNAGIQYQLYNGSASMGGFVAGTGSAIDFGMQASTGGYTVVATDPSTACTNNMNGNATVSINPLPAQQLVTGGGNYCSGSDGVSVGLAGSSPGASYQLYNGAAAVGIPFSGTGLPIDFGLQLAAGTYTVGAINAASCMNTMTGSVAINLTPLPNVYTLTGGGNFCSGGTGVDIALGSSDVGVNYQLYNGTAPVGAPIAGTGFAIDFGMQTAPGTYIAAATNGTTMCTSNMASSVIISVTAVPVTYTVGGGGNYCTGGSGVNVTLASSDAGVTYQLLNGGVPVASPVNGTGTMLDFGLQTAPGTYSVVATNIATTCINNMGGSATVGINTLPATYSVGTTSNHYCSGSGGVDIQLSGSATGVNYQLYNGATIVGTPVSGTGTTVDFGYWLAAGSYSVVATNVSTGCQNNMSGHSTIVVDPLPVVYTVTGGGSYCGAGAGTHVGLGNSDAGITYQLFSGSTPMGGIVAGTGRAIDFGLQTAGNYNVVAVSPLTGCSSTMTGTANVVMNTPPAAFAVTGGGNYCAGGTGSDIGLSSSATGTSYRLFKGSAAVGSAISGTGAALDFGLQLSGTYTVIASDAVSGCAGTMAGGATIGVNAAPAAYLVTGGGNFCPGGSGVHIALNNSTLGVDYQLYSGGTAVGSPVSGIGAGIDFGLVTSSGAYTVQALNTTTGCVANMNGHASVVVNTLPTVYNVTGGGSFCAGGAGTHLGLSNSAAGVNYTLFSSSATVRTLPGTGGPLDFGLHNVADSYAVVATDATTGCANTMSGRAVIVSTPVVTPHVFATSDLGDSVCGGSFVTYTVTSLNAGTAPTYRWTVNGVTAGVGDTYAYTPSDGDVVSVTLTSSANCATPTSVSNTVNMNVDPQGAPAVNVTTTPGTAVCQGTSVTYAAVPIYGGSTPTYVWTKNGATISTASGFSYTPANGDIIAVMLTSNYRCRLANSATSPGINMEVDVPSTPSVSISSYPAADIIVGHAVTFTAVATGAGSAPTYRWLMNGALILGVTNSTYVTSNLANGDVVACNVTTGGSCAGLTGSGNVTVHVFGVGVQQVNAQADIQLIPNPNKGTFVLKGTVGTTEKEAAIEVTDLLGKVVYKGGVAVNGGMVNQKIELGNMANGMYLLSLRCGAENRVYHMVVEQ